MLEQSAEEARIHKQIGANTGSSERVSENERNRVCKRVYGVLNICVGDVVTVYPRSGRALVSFTGVVVDVGDNALLLRTPRKLVVFRFSEIKFIEKEVIE